MSNKLTENVRKLHLKTTNIYLIQLLQATNLINNQFSNPKTLGSMRISNFDKKFGRKSVKTGIT